MKKTLSAALAALIIALAAPLARTDPSALALVRVSVAGPEEAAVLFERFDETHNHAPGIIELLLWPGDRAELDALGFSYRVVTEDINARDLDLAGGPQPLVELPGPDRTDYRHLDDYNAELQQLAKENPKLVKLIEFPNPSLEGRSILGVEIGSDVKRIDGRPIFYVDGVHHAREWPAGEFVMIYAHYLVERFNKDPEVTGLLKAARVIAVPIVNVDGFDYSRESVLSANQTVADNTDETGLVNGFEGYWRKNRRSLTGVTVPVAQKNPDAFGVDPNRNYSYLWGDSQGGSSGNVYDQTYRGEAPFSEPEVVNVRDLVLSRTIAGVITNHTYQASVLRAGGGDAPDDDILEPLGARMAEEMGYKNAGTVGYPTTGTTDDWSYAVTGTLGFTIEHGLLGFHPPYADSVGADHAGVMKAFMIMLDAVADPKYHSTIKGKVDAEGATVLLTKKFKTPLSPGNPVGKDSVTEKIAIPLRTDKDGSFEFHVGPSTRPYVSKGETYTLTIKAGKLKKTFQIDIDRGEVIDLGVIEICKGCVFASFGSSVTIEADPFPPFP